MTPQRFVLVTSLFLGAATGARAASPHPQLSPPGTVDAQAPTATVPAHVQLAISSPTQHAYGVVVRTAAGETACGEAVSRLSPCLLSLPPGPVTIVFKDGPSAQVELSAGQTRVTLVRDRWTLTLPGVAIMTAGLVLEIVGASADNGALTVAGLLAIGVGAGTLLVGVALPTDTLEVRRDEFVKVSRQHILPAQAARPLMAALTWQF